MKWRINRVASLGALLRAAVLAFPFAPCLVLFFNLLLPWTRWHKLAGSNSPLPCMEEQKYGLKGEEEENNNQVDFQEIDGIYLLKVHKWFGSQRPQEVSGIQTSQSWCSWRYHTQIIPPQENLHFLFFFFFFLKKQRSSFSDVQRGVELSLQSLSWQSCLENWHAISLGNSYLLICGYFF